MGRTAAISYEQVKDFLNRLQAEGDRPTIDQVWEAFGRKGSKGTIHKLVKRHQDEAGAQRAPASLRLLPVDLQSVIFAFADHTAHLARQAVAAELLEYQEHAITLADDNERLSADVVQRDEELKCAVAEMRTLGQRTLLLESELAGARDQITRERAAVERATTSFARLEQRLEDARKAQDELTLVREECARERRARIESEVALAEMRGQKALYEQRAQDLTASLANARAACRKIEMRNAELDTQLKGAERELADTQRQLAVQCGLKPGQATRASRPSRAASQGQLGLDSNATDGKSG